MSAVDEYSIVATIGGRSVGRAQVLRWEDGRITAAATRIGVDPPVAGPVNERRIALLESKLGLGSAEIERRLRRDVRLSGPIAAAQSRMSGRRRVSVADLMVPGATAAGFVAWFRSATDSSDEVAMLRACPDHFVIRTRADGRQEVLETTGGSPLASAFLVDYGHTSSVVTPADDAFGFQVAGVALGTGDRPIGGVRHQFRDTDVGLHARLTVEFPLTTLSHMIAAHRWHLACEFSNWILDAFG